LAVPLSTTRLICATGTSCSSTIQTGRPLDSFCFWIAGSFSGAGGPAAADACGRAPAGRRVARARQEQATNDEREAFCDVGADVVVARFFLRFDRQLHPLVSGRNCAAAALMSPTDSAR
jgi:hypothetical protein